LLVAPTGSERQLQLSERFIEPDLTLQTEIFADEPPQAQQRSMA
jgi:hypothetical protein